MIEHNRNERRNASIEQKLGVEVRINKIRAKELRQKQRFESGEPRSKRTVGYPSTP